MVRPNDFYDSRYLVGPPGEAGPEGPAGDAGPSGATVIDFEADLGTIHETDGLAAEVEVEGVLSTNAIQVNLLGIVPIGVAIAHARVIADGMIEINFVSTIGAPVALGTLTYRLTVF